jgi:nucleotide-binding universal stress UspA family protein
MDYIALALSLDLRRCAMMTTVTQPPMKILLAVDGSEQAWVAVTLLQNLPINIGRQSGSQVTVMGVLAPRNASDQIELQSILERACNLLQETGLNAVTGLRIGHPAETLVGFADHYQPDLIVIGAKGRRAALDILLGGVAQQVIEYTRWPVMVVRGTDSHLKRVLLVTDGSKYSQRAVEYLARFPLLADTEIHIVHVLPPLYLPEMTMPTWPVGSEVIPPISARETSEIASQRASEEEQQGQVLLTHTVENLERINTELYSGHSPHLPIVKSLLRGDATAEIIDYGKTQQIDLIIAGSRGLGSIKGWLLGSVSHKLVHYAGCSVLIARCTSNR